MHKFDKLTIGLSALLVFAVVGSLFFLSTLASGKKTDEKKAEDKIDYLKEDSKLDVLSVQATPSPTPLNKSFNLPAPTKKATPKPTPSPTPAPTTAPTSSPTPAPTSESTPTPTSTPEPTPTPTPEPTPTPSP